MTTVMLITMNTTHLSRAPVAALVSDDQQWHEVHMSLFHTLHYLISGMMLTLSHAASLACCRYNVLAAGGAMFVGQADSFTLTSCTAIGNIIAFVSPSNYTSFGGAFAFQQIDSFQLDKVTIYSNKIVVVCTNSEPVTTVVNFLGVYAVCYVGAPARCIAAVTRCRAVAYQYCGRKAA
jgi:hypothetical protein